MPRETESLRVPGYSGLNPRSIYGDLGVQVLAAIEVARELPAGVIFGVTEVSLGDQMWDFPFGVRTVFEFAGEHFSGVYHIAKDGSQYRGAFSTADSQSSGPTRRVIAEAFGYNPDIAVKIVRPVGIDSKEGVDYYKLQSQRRSLTRPTAPGGTVSIQVNNYRPNRPR